MFSVKKRCFVFYLRKKELITMTKEASRTTTGLEVCAKQDDVTRW